MLRLAEAWTWDFWLADDGRCHHLYFLKAPRDIGDPDLRHWNVTIGHAVSADLVEWTVAADAIAPAGSRSFDDIGTWTGSVVRGPGAKWFMFYTGTGSHERGLKQRIGLATSTDLYHWDRHPASPVLESAPAGMSSSATGTGQTRRGVTRGCSLARTATPGTCC